MWLLENFYAASVVFLMAHAVWKSAEGCREGLGLPGANMTPGVHVMMQ